MLCPDFEEPYSVWNCKNQLQRTFEYRCTFRTDAFMGDDACSCKKDRIYVEALINNHKAFHAYTDFDVELVGRYSVAFFVRGSFRFMS